MEFHQLIVQRIKQLLEEKHLTQYALARRSGVPCSTISMITCEKVKSIGSMTLLSLCRGLNISISEFFNDEMFNMENIKSD